MNALTLSRRTLTAALCGLILSFAPRAFAQNASVNITLNPDAQSLVDQLGIDVGQLEGEIRDQITGLYGLADVGEFLRLSANAQTMTNKGLGVDYTSSADGFMFGFAANVAASGGEDELKAIFADPSSVADTAVPVSAGVQMSVMLGYNFAGQGLPGLSIYAHGLYYPLSVSQLDGTFYNFGGHVQYNLFGPLGNDKVFQWSGLALTSGLESSRMRLTLSETFETESDYVQNLSLRTRSTGTLKITQRALSVPLEASTAIRLFYFVSVFAGVGLDFQFGQSSMTMGLDSELESDAPPELGGGNVQLGTAEITVDGLGDPNQTLFRVFGGVQANLGPVRLFTQLNLATADLTVAVALGLRLMF